ncbi:putative serine/threonine dehydratase, pyridoxal-phosphate-binding protein [Septoria linicola]|nr:putative serine/threonine dehydratase, pyridoxal-phosphate-binding protein [Septoria linicola]
MTGPSLPYSTQSHTSSPPTDKPWRETPLIESAKLSQAAGCRVFLKLEHLQPSGSFKIRGLGNFVLNAYRASRTPEKVHFFSSSGGNAGLAAVLAAQFVGRPCTVVVPHSTKARMIEKIKQAGASEVIQEGASWKEADTYMREVVMRRAAEERGEDAVGVHPFDHPDIWEGHSSMIDEVRKQMPGGEVPDWVICSAGGGGLFCGVVQGVQKQGDAWSDTRVVVVETEGADALAKSVDAGELITLPAITSIVTSLGARRVGDRTWELASQGVKSGKIRNVVLSDAEAAMGCWKLFDDENILVEAACGVNTALCYGDRLQKALSRIPRPDEKVVIVVCGGSNISTDIIEQWRKEYAHVS